MTGDLCFYEPDPNDGRYPAVVIRERNDVGHGASKKTVAKAELFDGPIKEEDPSPDGDAE